MLAGAGGGLGALLMKKVFDHKYWANSKRSFDTIHRKISYDFNT